MLIKHFFINKIAHSSYILAGSEVCAVIDPQRDIDVYIYEARAPGVVITHILHTHLHADFVSGHMDLAEYYTSRRQTLILINVSPSISRGPLV